MESNRSALGSVMDDRQRKKESLQHDATSQSVAVVA